MQIVLLKHGVCYSNSMLWCHYLHAFSVLKHCFCLCTDVTVGRKLLKNKLKEKLHICDQWPVWLQICEYFTRLSTYFVCNQLCFHPTSFLFATAIWWQLPFATSFFCFAWSWYSFCLRHRFHQVNCKRDIYASWIVDLKIQNRRGKFSNHFILLRA